MPTSITALEAHLKAQPDDWSSWLVYGDHLTEQGDVRGELIRLGHLHAGAQLPADRASLEKQIAALVEQHRNAWRQTVPVLSTQGDESTPPRVQLQWRHGFVVGLELDWVERMGPALETFLASPDSRLLGTLAITRSGVGSADDGEGFEEDDPDEETVDSKEVVAALEGVLAQDLSRLRTLSFAYFGMQAAGAKVLARAKGLSALVQLDLRYNDLRAAGLKALCEAPFLSQLEALHLQSNAIGPAGVKALAALDLPKLQLLDLRRNALKSTGARALAVSRLLSKLTTLGLHRDDLGTAGVKAIAQSEQLPMPLRTLWKALSAVKPTTPAPEDD